VGNIGFRNATSGTTTLAPATGALGTGTVTLPLSGTLAISSGAQTFTGTQTFGAIDATSIGATTRGTGAFTTLAANSTVTSTGRFNQTANINCLSGTLSFGDGTQFIGGYDSGSDRSFFFSGVIASGAVSSLKPMLFHGSNHKFYTDAAATLGTQLTTTQWSLNYTADSTTPTTGAMVLSGGLGVAKAVNIGTTLAVTGASTLTGLLTANGGITLGDAQNIAFNTTTGTKIGAATTQKIGFWNSTPIVQPTTAVASATVASPGGGTNIKTDDTFDGYTIAQVVKALRNAGLLA
jgi:hypothetical protein